MRINFFFVLLVLLTFTSTGKLLYLFDKVIIATANIDTKSHSIFHIEAAEASLADSIANANSPNSNENSSNSGNQQSKNTPPNAKNIADISFNSDEVRLLKELSKRREELDDYAKQLHIKESLLNSTKDKIEKKLEHLKEMEIKITSLMEKLDAKTNLRIKSLAKIYENMKPKDAAKIFDELEMSVLLEIVRNMKAQKVGPIIANMDAAKARDISIEFAKINDEITSLK